MYVGGVTSEPDGLSNNSSMKAANPHICPCLEPHAIRISGGHERRHLLLVTSLQSRPFRHLSFRVVEGGMHVDILLLTYPFLID